MEDILGIFLGLAMIFIIIPLIVCFLFCPLSEFLYMFLSLYLPDKMYLRLLIDRQVRTLISLGCHQIMGLSKQEFKKLFSSLKEKVYWIPNAICSTGELILVIPPEIMPIEQQMQLLAKKFNQQASIHININQIKNREGTQTAQDVYYIGDIRDGMWNFDDIYGGHYETRIPRIALDYISNSGMSGLTVCEGIALMIHDSIYGSDINLLGSDYNGQVPVLFQGAVVFKGKMGDKQNNGCIVLSSQGLDDFNPNIISSSRACEIVTG